VSAVAWARQVCLKFFPDSGGPLRRLAPALLLGLLLAGCQTMPSLESMKIATGLEKPKPPAPKTQMAALKKRILTLIEAERLKINPKAKPLTQDAELDTVAQERVSDMAAKNYFNHTAPSGQTSATLLMAADANFQGLLGENMAERRYNPSQGIDVDAFAKSFVDSWLASAPHRANLSFTDYNLTGIGAAVNATTVYVTQLFSTDLGMGPHKPGTPAPVATRYRDLGAAKTASLLRGPLMPAPQGAKAGTRP
jgi:uncharacterized protein YkwD